MACASNYCNFCRSRVCRELLTLGSNLTGRGRDMGQGIMMNILKSTGSASTSSLSTLTFAAHSGSAASAGVGVSSSSNVSYKQLPRTEREAELESGDQYVL